ITAPWVKHKEFTPERRPGQPLPLVSCRVLTICLIPRKFTIATINRPNNTSIASSIIPPPLLKGHQAIRLLGCRQCFPESPRHSQESTLNLGGRHRRRMPASRRQCTPHRPARGCCTAPIRLCAQSSPDPPVRPACRLCASRAARP